MSQGYETPDRRDIRCFAFLANERADKCDENEDYYRRVMFVAATTEVGFARQTLDGMAEGKGLAAFFNLGDYPLDVRCGLGILGIWLEIHGKTFGPISKAVSSRPTAPHGNQLTVLLVLPWLVLPRCSLGLRSRNYLGWRGTC